MRGLGLRRVQGRRGEYNNSPAGLSARARQDGMSLIEVMIALVVLTVSVFMLTSTITSSANQSTTKFERAIASDAAMNLLEEMRSKPFNELFKLYNHDPSDDPGAIGSAPGANFDVQDLHPIPGDPDGHVGEVILPSIGSVLREDSVIPSLGLPRDLSGDSKVDDKNHANDYILLPVCVRLEWQGKSGKQALTMYTTFSKLAKQ
jgi:prepilin-type N-terminal cleavage/methylation domain-containing protein